MKVKSHILQMNIWLSLKANVVEHIFLSKKWIFLEEILLPSVLII